MKTLEELKAENAAAEQEQIKTPEPIETGKDEVIEKTETDEEQSGDESDEDWLKSDEQRSEMPVETHIKVKHKLKGRIKAEQEENERLRAENEQLKKAQTPNVIPEIPKRPLEDDFDTREDYIAALDDYETKKVSAIVARTRQEETYLERQKRAEKEIETAVESHYNRAAKFIETSSIKPEVYQKADEIVRNAAEIIMPNMGDAVIDQLISKLGDGSEKVMYSVGRNDENLTKFKALLAEDPSGIKAAMFLGQQQERLTKSISQKSKAPAPAASVNGESVPGSVSKFKKQYEEAHKKGDIQGAWNAKKAARTAGATVSDW